MKTSRLGMIAITWMATVIGFTGFSYGQTVASSAGFKHEKAAVNKDLNKINEQQERVKTLRQQCADEHAGGVKTSNTHSELLRAKADLKRDKMYLRADKEQLNTEHQAVIELRAAQVREDRAQLTASRKKLDADLKAGNATAVLHAQEIVNLQQTLDKHEQALDQARASRDADMVAINKEIRDYNGQNTALLPENSSARNQNLAMK
jgi:chromosome segregation ATPase